MSGPAASTEPAGPSTLNARLAPSPALRLVSDRGRIVRPRAAVFGLGLLVRAGLIDGCTVWPSISKPSEVVDVRSGRPARWLHEEFGTHPGSRVPRPLRRLLGPATSGVLRARALIMGKPARSILKVVEATLDRPLRRPKLALYSPSGMQTSKVVCFVFEGSAREPTVAVQAMADPAMSERLSQELAAIERVRKALRTEASLERTLPSRPLRSVNVEVGLLAILPVDPLAGYTGRDSRARAYRWLRRFQELTSTGKPVPEIQARETARLRSAWGRLRPGSAGRIVEAAHALMRESSLDDPGGIVHGDFWRGNVAVGPNGSMRVFDWEWTEMLGHPAIDLLTYEVGEVRMRARDLDDAALRDQLRAGTEVAGAELRRRGLNPDSAKALLGPTVGRLAERGHRNVADPHDPLVRVMIATETILSA